MTKKIRTLRRESNPDKRTSFSTVSTLNIRLSGKKLKYPASSNVTLTKYYAYKSFLEACININDLFNTITGYTVDQI